MVLLGLAASTFARPATTASNEGTDEKTVIADANDDFMNAFRESVVIGLISSKYETDFGSFNLSSPIWGQ